MKSQKWYVYGYTDRYCGVGFPASEKAFETKEAAEKHLKTIGRKGFKFKNKDGKLGWVQKN
jgi:hypothetical protein